MYDSCSSGHKILRFTETSAWCNNLREENHRLVFTNGCFDILHSGHVRYLQRARAMGNALMVGLNSDSSVRRLKGKGRPIIQEYDRAWVLSALEAVDAVVIFGEDTPARLIEHVLPDVLVKGGDYRVEDIVGYDTVIRHGGRVEVVPFFEGRSTSLMINRIQEQK